jgi:ADP-heptose:LPS heptosyltransferase
MTLYPELFIYNKNITNVHKFSYVEGVNIKVWNTYDMVVMPFDTEKHHHYHMDGVDFQSINTIGKQLPIKDKWFEVNFSDKERSSMRDKVRELGIDLDRPFLLWHPHGAEWITRTTPKDVWQAVCARVVEKYPSYQHVSIGGKRGDYEKHELNNYCPLENKVIDIFGKLTLLESIALMSEDNAKALISMDTGPIHLAACTKLDIIAFFTTVKSIYRTPIRKEGIFFPHDNTSNCDCLEKRKFYDKIPMIFSVCPQGRKKNLPCLPTEDQMVKHILLSLEWNNQL